MKKHQKITAVGLPLAVTVLIPLFRLYVTRVKAHILPCPFRLFAGVYCISCGGTRCISALLDGNLLLALRQNTLVAVLLLLLLLYWIQCVALLFGRKIKTIPESRKFYALLSGSAIIYIVARNFIPYIAPV